MNKNIRYYFLSVIAVLTACSDKTNDFSDAYYVEPMLYSIDLMMQTSTGNSSENIVTRGVNYNDSKFTNKYEDEYIYIHSADNLTKEKGHQVLQVPIEPEVLACDSCGIHLQIEVFANQSYTITSGENSITIESGAKVFFSNYPDAIWTADVIENASPITQKDVFIRGDKNKELLRSKADYSVGELLDLAANNPRIPLGRHCTGFRVNLMFSSYSPQTGDYGVSEEYFASQLAALTDLEQSQCTIGHFYIKTYVGPWFCHSFDMYNRSVNSEDEGGYYVTENNTYKEFGSVFYSSYRQEEQGGTGQTYRGFGYETGLHDLLLAPMNLTIVGADVFTVYTFIKYIPEGSSVDLSSDENSFYFSVGLADLSTSPNRIHRSILVFDYLELANIIKWTLHPDTFPTSESSSQTLTRGLSFADFPKRIDAEPLQIYSVIEK